jgi:5-methylcytosine-specific restriction enzyme A
MASRGKYICKMINCNELIDKPGYCEAHKKESNPFKHLDNKKTNETISFYRSSQWTKTSLLFRKLQPLCQDCLRVGKVTAGTLVHHDPELTYLLANNMNPYSFEYLETLCFNCHQRHLRAKSLK